MDESLWPARHVAEHAYCPRLFYYMEVEGVFLPSDDTEEGKRIHRRVDAPSQKKKPRPSDGEASSEPPHDADRPLAVRSLALTSSALGLTATLDLAQIEGRTATPVEYRKGRPNHHGDAAGSGEVEPWPTDRVQVGLQAILLEEAGFTVNEAVLYYAAEKRRVVVPVDESLRREALDTLAAAKKCAAGPRPLPLVNDPRCPRCSLQPICLPDEVNRQRAADESTTPRRMWPPRDDGIHLVAQSGGARIGVRGASLKITDRDGKAKDLPLAGVESLSLVGAVQLSTQAVQTLADRGVPVAFLSAAGRMIAMLDPLDSVSAETRKSQVRVFDRPEAVLEFARALVVAKIANQRTLLMRNSRSSSRSRLPDETSTTPNASDPFESTSPSPPASPTLRPVPPTQRNHPLRRVLSDMKDQIGAARRADNVESLRGHEGQSAALYFERFAGMIHDEDAAAAFQAQGRRRRPPPDPVNAVLSFAYTMLTHECTAALRTARLEPSIGAFHTSRPGRPALSLDLMEPFRPLIADSIAVTGFNRGEFRPGHFNSTSAGCSLTDHGRRAFFAVYGRRLSEEVTHPVFGYRLSYRRMLILHALMIAAWITGEIPNLEFMTTR